MKINGRFPAAFATSRYVQCALGPVIPKVNFEGPERLESAGSSPPISTLVCPVTEVTPVIPGVGFLGREWLELAGRRR